MIMKVAEIKFAAWDKIYYFSLANLNTEMGDRVIVDTEAGEELGTIVGFAEINESDFILKDNSSSKEHSQKEEDEDEQKKIIKPIIRKATKTDLGKMPTTKEKEKAFFYCKKMIEKRKLEMKLVDASFSFSGNRITFAFIADGRVDFRELVKDLTSHFNKLIRLNQIGVRDEAKFMGDYGHCGRKLCCKTFMNDFVSISSEMTEAQQVTHRGSERLSGSCGRLMCCLAHEHEGYEELVEKMPEIGQKVNVDGKKGIIVNTHILKQSVDVEFNDKKNGKIVMEIDLNRNKKK